MLADSKYQDFVQKAFEQAGLPEVDENQLETGTYTNDQIVGMMLHDPMKLMLMLTQISNQGSAAEKRSILSFAVEMIASGNK